MELDRRSFLKGSLAFGGAAALGLAVPYMPIGSPGMEVEDGRRQAYDVLLVQRDGSAKTFTHYPAIAGKRS